MSDRYVVKKDGKVLATFDDKPAARAWLFRNWLVASAGLPERTESGRVRSKDTTVTIEPVMDEPEI